MDAQTKTFRVGQIVPSSNTTMETEIPAMLRAREGVLPERVDRTGVDAFVAWACVQMPSLAIMDRLEQRIGVPVVSAAVCTTHQMLDRLGLERRVPGAGSLLGGRY